MIIGLPITRGTGAASAPPSVGADEAQWVARAGVRPMGLRMPRTRVTRVEFGHTEETRED